MSQTGLLVRLADPPADLSLLLFMEEVASRLLLFQLGRSYLCHAAWTVEFGCRERDSKDFTYTSLCVCQISFYPFCLSSNITNKGKSFYYSSLPQGRL